MSGSLVCTFSPSGGPLFALNTNLTLVSSYCILIFSSKCSKFVISVTCFIISILLKLLVHVNLLPFRVTFVYACIPMS